MEAWLQGVFADTPVLTVPWSIDCFSVIAGAHIARGANCDGEVRKGASGGSDAVNSDRPANMR